MFIKKYKLKNGELRYKFGIYTGIDKQTGRKTNTTRSGFKTKKEAVLAASKLEIELSEGKIEKPKDIKYGDVYQEWLPAYENTVRESTLLSTTNIFKNHILNHFSDKKINTITVSEIQTIVNKWFDIAPVNFKKWFYYTGKIFEYAIKMGYLDKNPCRLVTLPKNKKEFAEKKLLFWDKKQLDVFFKCLYDMDDDKKFVFFRLLAFSGMRRGECLALTWEDINFKENTIDINKTISQGINRYQVINPPKTKKSMRKIIMDQKTMDYLYKWKMEQRKQMLNYGFNTLNKKQMLFTTRNNTMLPLSAPSKWLKLVISKYDLPSIKIHGFRHSHASALFASGATIKEVQERLGHEDAQTTLNVYTHVTSNQNKDVVVKLESYLGF
ncbi:Putative prophage phiRv2 integrase [Apilactobacillus kunkeei]|nr:Putative prophage phiRv2 integrase [Apilactobacillus kunkeei]CAI2580222.1 Putative prophage phiRv2 integrase [Apilactobacillus kunkeei]CAI2580581.1 Putative prophage phiRv2 integrase [Apilactobacillus kunkeei]CAI2580878.1 Putative prophage phiRv2 integrase [Apilactobacillus kunkeei]CAI2646557.1 Putative prophage phiRv2 integrase [Apilactobacillus kunkeei]